MIKCQNNQLLISFPEVHPLASCLVTFQRTLRLPDDDKTYPLPPGLGAFPLQLIDDHADRLSEDTKRRGGVMLPMYQAEALWIQFAPAVPSPDMHGLNYPIALKIGAGKRSAVTGKAWEPGLSKNDYVVVPGQPWLDGFMSEAGVVRQFVAAPLGQGFTVEEQLTGKAEFGGLQIEAFPMHRYFFDNLVTQKIARDNAERERREQERRRASETYGSAPGRPMRGGLPMSAPPRSASMPLSVPAPAAASMGMAAGGRMKQQIHPDPYRDINAWNQTTSSRTFVHLFNSLVWRQISGQAPPQVPPTASEYKNAGLPWYEWYSDAGALGPTTETAQIKSVQQMAEEKGYGILPENQSVDVKATVAIKAPKDPFAGDW